MPMRNLTLALIALVAAACGGSANSTEAWTSCRGTDADRSIAGCTALIDSTKQPDSLRAEALMNRGNAYRGKGDYDRSMDDYNKAIALRPAFASAYNSRGMAWTLKGNYDSAVTNFSQAVRINPAHAQALKNRGRAHFYLGHFAEAASDLQAGLKTDSTNTYVVIWLHMARKRAGADDAQEFAANLQRTDTTAWPAPIAKYYLGKRTDAELMADATTVPPKSAGDQQCAVHFYIGENALMEHHDADAAHHFMETRAKCPKVYTEYQAAAAELDRVGH